METKIAKENVELWRKQKSGMAKTYDTLLCMKHKQTCQRWLEFLILTTHPKVSKAIGKRNLFGDKIKDLKQAIKIYDEAGV